MGAGSGKLPKAAKGLGPAEAPEAQGPQAPGVGPSAETPVAQFEASKAGAGLEPKGAPHPPKGPTEV